MIARSAIIAAVLLIAEPALAEPMNADVRGALRHRQNVCV